MRIREYGKQMAAIRVKPRRAECNFYASTRLQEPAHHPQDFVGLFKMFKRIETDDHVGDRVASAPFLDDRAAIAQAVGAHTLGGAGKPRRVVFDADDATRAMLGKFNDFMCFAATEVDDDLVLHLIPDARPEEHFKLAPVLVRGRDAFDHPGRLARGTDRLQELYCSSA